MTPEQIELVKRIHTEIHDDLMYSKMFNDKLRYRHSGARRLVEVVGEGMNLSKRLELKDNRTKIFYNGELISEIAEDKQ